MATTTDHAGPPVARERSTAARRTIIRPVWAGLAGVLALSFVLDFYQLSRNGFANTYYAAAVRSMSESLHNFFFSGFDPGGYVTIDKPPVGFWFQVLSVKIFGYHGTSLLFPEALAGVLAVVVLFVLVRRHFGDTAGLIAALALAVTPISVATSRNNTIDSLLAFTLILAAGALLLALETGRLRWLLLAMALVGIGFNIKMAEAFVALPAFGLAYFLGAPISWRKRILHLIAAGAVLSVVALSWVTTVDLIPSGQRPYVGSSQHNSELELALGYNGINRLLPRRFFGGRDARPPQRPAAAVNAAGSGALPPGVGTGNLGRGQFNGANGRPAGAGTPSGAARQPAQFGPPGFGFGSTGLPAALRLFSQQLASQLSWLMPLAAVGLLAAAWQAPLSRKPSPRQRALLIWGGWFLCCGLLFTFDEAARPYYMVTLAPATAALTGIGSMALWHDYRVNAVRGWLLPMAVAGTAAVEVWILRPYPDWNRWLSPLLIAAGAAAVVALVVARLGLAARVRWTVAAAGAAVGLLALFIAPAVWSGVTVARAAPGGLPTAGPLTTGFGFAGTRQPVARRANSGPDAEINVDAKLLAYLEQHRDGAKFLVATTNAQSAAPFIIKTGEPVMALGGFTGSDPIQTPDELAQSVNDGAVRFFLVAGAPSASAQSPRTTAGNGAAPAAADSESGAGAGGQSGQAAGRNGRTSQAATPPFGGVGPGRAEATQAANGTNLAIGGFPGFFGRGNALQTWVASNCSAVPSEDWRSSSTPTPAGGFGFGFGGGGNQQLYDCGG